jgi:hypothetical protein
MLCIGNLITFLEALDYRTYIDKTREEDLQQFKIHTQRILACHTFADFRSWLIDGFIVRKDGKIQDINQDIFHVCLIYAN